MDQLPQVEAVWRRWEPRFIAAGTDYNIMLKLKSEIQDWTEWCQKWSEKAADLEIFGDEAMERGHIKTAALSWNAAAMLYQFGGMYYIYDMDQFYESHRKKLAAFAKAVPHFDPPVERFEVSYDGVQLACYLRVPKGVEKPPVVIFNNGSEYLNLLDAPALLDQLIAQRLVPPMVAVFVPAINAAQDYGLNDAYVKFLADELMPFVQENFDTSLDPKSTAIIGLADGARAAVHATVSRPDIFGLAGSQSGTFTGDDIAFIREISRLEAGGITTDPSRYHLIVGTYETSVGNNGSQADYLEANRQMAAILEEAGYQIMLSERPEGHSWGFWQGTLGQTLSQLLN